MRLGIDFDNTIVRYDDVFQRLAVAQGLIPESVAPYKQAVRDYLRADGREEDWIRLQGEVYGPGMAHARPFEDVFDTIDALTNAGVEIFVISHRTKHPFRGPPYDLHAAANDWLVRTPASPLPRDRIFFETTKEAKLDRIGRCRCTHFIDDLPEFLTLPGFPSGVERLHFDPSGACGSREAGVRPMPNWRAIREYLLS